MMADAGIPESGTYVCGVVLLREDGAALLQLRDDVPHIQDPGLWVFPGGHVEPAETLEDGARRELLEETCYQCGELHQCAAYRANDIGYSTGHVIVFFWCRFDGKQDIVCCEGQCVRFVARNEVEGLPRPNYLVEVWDRALAASPKVTGRISGSIE